VANQVTNAQVISSTAVSEMQKEVAIISIQLEVLDYAQLTASQPNTEESL